MVSVHCCKPWHNLGSTSWSVNFWEINWMTKLLSEVSQIWLDCNSNVYQSYPSYSIDVQLIAPKKLLSSGPLGLLPCEFSSRFMTWRTHYANIWVMFLHKCLSPVSWPTTSTTQSSGLCLHISVSPLGFHLPALLSGKGPEVEYNECGIHFLFLILRITVLSCLSINF